MKAFLKYYLRNNEVNAYTRFMKDMREKCEGMNFSEHWRYYTDKELKKYKATMVYISVVEVYLYFEDDRHKSLFLLKYS